MQTGFAGSTLLAVVCLIGLSETCWLHPGLHCSKSLRPSQCLCKKLEEKIFSISFEVCLRTEYVTIVLVITEVHKQCSPCLEAAFLLAQRVSLPSISAQLAGL